MPQLWCPPGYINKNGGISNEVWEKAFPNGKKPVEEGPAIDTYAERVKQAHGAEVLVPPKCQACSDHFCGKTPDECSGPVESDEMIYGTMENASFPLTCHCGCLPIYNDDHETIDGHYGHYYHCSCGRVGNTAKNKEAALKGWNKVVVAELIAGKKQ
jgi:hypothetical protein